jgi:hypothetical protein
MAAYEVLQWPQNDRSVTEMAAALDDKKANNSCSAIALVQYQTTLK